MNSLAYDGKRRGALLKIQFSEELVGYADLHPHPELGDEVLEEQLAGLGKGEPSKLTRRSVHWALIDAHARKKGESLFASLQVPKTHALVTDLENFKVDQLQDLKAQGYEYLKVKMGKDLPNETQKVLQLIPQLQGISLRIDFNESLDVRVFSDWWNLARGVLEEHVDFIEDPFPYRPEAWRASKAPLALDRPLNLENLKTFDGSVVVFKPAISDTHWLNTIQHRVVFSTYMDHPVGEMSAIFAAAQHYAHGGEGQVCGLRTWHLFDTNEFSEILSDVGPELSVADGTGLGFDEQLRSQNWKPLL